MKKSQMCLINNVNFVDLYTIVRYIYVGELTIDRDYLSRFIKIGDLFGINDIHDLEIDIDHPNVSDVSQHVTKNEEEAEIPEVDNEVPELVEIPKKEVEIQEAPKVVEIEIVRPSKMPNILRSTTRSAGKMPKLRVLTQNKAPVKDDEKEFLKQVNLVPYNGPKKPSATQKRPAATKKQPAAIKKPVKRLIIKLPRSSRRLSIGPQNIECRYCSRPYNVTSSLKNHERFCFLNPNRSVSTCNICNEEVKPGSMTFHKRRYHENVPIPRRMTVDVQMLNAEN